MASFVAKFIRKCQIIENSVFHLGEKKNPDISQKIVKMLYFDIAAKKKILIFPVIKQFVILEM